MQRIGIEVIEDEEATELLRPLPLQSTLVFLGTIQEQLRPVQDDPVSQGGMLGAFLPLDDDQKLMVAKWITAREDIQHIVLAPHQVMTVQRLALFHCEDRDDTRGLETHEIATLMRLIVNANNTGGPGFNDDATLLRWSVGAPTSESAFSYRYGTALAIHMFGEIAKRDGMNERSDFCDIEAWCQDRYGGSVHELHRELCPGRRESTSGGSPEIG